jgi:small subunit ribosomal protein S4
VHGRRPRRPSDYWLRLREKQRLRHQYHIREGQLRRTVREAARRPGKTGENLIVLLEQRLDALVWRAGLARTIYQARQLVSHGHITVNGRKVDRPSYRVKPGETIEVRESSRDKLPFVLAARAEHAAGRPASYLDVDLGALRATLLRLPGRAEVPVQCEEQLVVEYYSR